MCAWGEGEEDRVSVRERERREMVGGRAAALAYKTTMAHRMEKCAISIKNSNGASREKCAITMSRSGSKLGQT